MSSSTYRKCPECGTINKDRDYCENCGTLINMLLRRQKERQVRIEEKKAAKRIKEPSAVSQFFENFRNHKNPLVRGLAKVLYSVWLVIFAIGAFFAYVIGYIAA